MLLPSFPEDEELDVELEATDDAEDGIFGNLVVLDGGLSVGWKLLIL